MRSVCWVGVVLCLGCGSEPSDAPNSGAAGVGGFSNGNVVKKVDAGMRPPDAGRPDGGLGLALNTLEGDLGFAVKHVRIASATGGNGAVSSVSLVFLDHEADCLGNPLNGAWPPVEKVLVVWLTSSTALTSGTVLQAPGSLSGGGQVLANYGEYTNFRYEADGGFVATAQVDLQNVTGWGSVASMEIPDDAGTGWLFGIRATGEFDLRFGLPDGGTSSLTGAYDARHCL